MADPSKSTSFAIDWGATATILSVILGAFLTYWFGIRDRKKKESREVNIKLARLIPELTWQVTRLSLEIDGIGTAWLERLHSQLAHRPNGEKSIKIDNRGELPHRLYDQFSPNLIESELGTSLDSHYERLKAQNRFTSSCGSQCPVDDFGSYVQDLAILMEEAVDLINLIAANPGAKRLMDDDAKRLYNNFKKNESRYDFSAAIFRTRIDELEALESGHAVSARTPDILKKDPDGLRADWISRVRNRLG